MKTKIKKILTMGVMKTLDGTFDVLFNATYDNLTKNKLAWPDFLLQKKFFVITELIVPSSALAIYGFGFLLSKRRKRFL